MAKQSQDNTFYVLQVESTVPEDKLSLYYMGGSIPPSVPLCPPGDYYAKAHKVGMISEAKRYKTRAMAERSAKKMNNSLNFYGNTYVVKKMKERIE